MFDGNMKPAFNILFFGVVGISSFVLKSSATGKALPDVSSERVHAVEGRDVTLPCPVCASLKTSVVMEWSRVDRSPPVTLYVSRNGRELVREKAEEYVNRTAMVGDGALKISKVKRQDNGTYRVFLKGPETDQDALVFLIVADASEVESTIRRTSAGAQVLLCETRGWNPQPVISVLDGQRNPLAAETETWQSEPNGLYSVRASVDVASATGGTGNGTLICRVEIQGLNLAREGKTSFTDESGQSEKGRDRYMWIAIAVIAVFVIFVMLFFAPLTAVEKLRSSLQVFFNRPVEMKCVTRGASEETLLPASPDYSEYGDIYKIKASGASKDTARAHKQLPTELSGVEVSNKLASRDLKPMMAYRDIILSVGKELCVYPALIAAIISRQSQAGTKLKPDGFGQSDPNSFGLMQVNKNYHAVKGGPYSKEHVDLGVTILIHAVKTMWRMKKSWTKEEQLKGALAAYIAGEDRVILLEKDDVDSVTPFKDFSNDVVARAQWFGRNGF